MSSGSRSLLAALEAGLLAGLLLGTSTAALLAARNGLTPVQAPLTFALVFWKWLALAGAALAVPAAIAAGLVARATGRAGVPRAVLLTLALGYFLLVALYNGKAVTALWQQPGPARYRILLPVAFAAASVGAVMAGLGVERHRRATRLVALVAVTAAAIAFAPGRGARAVRAANRPISPRATREARERVLVVGIDGATWDMMDPLLARGELPHVAALRSRGAWGRLRSFEPTASPVIWTTIATGKRPEQHGVEAFTHARLEGVENPLPHLRPLKRMGFSWLCGQLAAHGKIRETPVTSTARRMPAFWNIASAHGSPVSVVGWWATWPAEPVLGHVVSERTYYSILDGDPDADEPQLTFPEALYDEIAKDIVAPDRMSYESARRFMDLTPEEFETIRRAAQSERKDLEGGLTYFYSLHETTRRVALHLLAKGRAEYGAAQDALVLFRIVDFAGHTSMRHSELVTEHPGSSDPQVRKYGRAVSEAYRLADQALGELLEAFGPGGNVVVVSDHGWALQSDGWGHRKAPDGILLASGPAIRAGRVDGLSVYDVLPLLLRIKGFPVARDLAGRVPEGMLAPEFLAKHLVAYVDSYGKRDELQVAAGSAAVDQDMLDRLRALGYLQ